MYHCLKSICHLQHISQEILLQDVAHAEVVVILEACEDSEGINNGQGQEQKQVHVCDVVNLCQQRCLTIDVLVIFQNGVQDDD